MSAALMMVRPSHEQWCLFGLGGCVIGGLVLLVFLLLWILAERGYLADIEAHRGAAMLHCRASREAEAEMAGLRAENDRLYRMLHGEALDEADWWKNFPRDILPEAEA